jgi:MFS family permease
VSGTFRSLRNHNFRLFLSGQVISLTGTWAQRIAQDWLVLDLTDDSGIALGITTALQFGPVLVLSLFAGLLADRYDKRTLLVAAQCLFGVLALALAALDLSGVVTLWQVYVLTGLLGVVTAFEIPIRQAFVVEMVGPEDLANAVGLNSSVFNGARLVGPAVAGLVIQVSGTGWVFLGNGVSFVAVVSGLLLMRRRDLHTPPVVERAEGQVREGLAYVRAHPQLSVTIFLVAVFGTFGMNLTVSIALLAKEVFRSSAGAFGLLTTVFAIGSLLGALLSARRTSAPRLRTLFVALGVFCVLEAAVSASPSYVVAAVLLVPTGLTVLTFTTTALTLVQTTVEQRMRGRVMALYVLVFIGGAPIGSPLLGWVAEVLGARASIQAGALACALGLVGALLFLRQTRAHAAPAA